MQGAVRDFNHDWKFAKGEQPDVARDLQFDDSTWESVRIPHDWAISGPFDESASGSTGKLPWTGVGWYRKKFTVEAGSDRRVYLDFDGVMAFPKVYINGELAGQWDYGYMSFRVDATPHIRFGEENVVAVEVDTRRHGSRWYPGAGIYRKVRMTIANPLHIAHWGTFVTTPSVSDWRATVRVRSTVDNHSSSDRELDVAVTIRDPEGNVVATGEKRGIAPAEGTVEVDQQMFVDAPARWDLEHPNLYTAETIVRSSGEVVDGETVTFGIRTFSFDPDRGFFLNGERVQLKGVNLHHDLGALGAAFNQRAMERQLQIMQEMGVNAVRTSHNAPAPEVLELCDRMGIFVWDECFDKWNATADNLAGPENVLPMAVRQLDNFVRRDRNHPCVFIWSVGNEIGTSVDERGDGMSFGRLEGMRTCIRQLDDTRPVGIGCHTPNTVRYPVYDPLDLTGWNYGRRYARYREAYPNNPILYSESASTVSTRGHYAFPLANNKTDYPGGTGHVSSYDLSATSWSDIPDCEFQLMEDDRFVGGEFVWTGFDYLGEPTPNRRDARSSYFGIVDLAGIPKDRYHLYRSHWRPNAKTIHILPHWNWPDRIGKKTPVFVYTNGDSAELFLNGRSLGRRTKGVVPPKPTNLAAAKPTMTSDGASAEAAVDGDDDTAWRHTDSGGTPWVQVDLQEVQPVEQIDLALGDSVGDAGYAIRVSRDGTDWSTIANIEPRTAGSRGWGRRAGGPRATYDLTDQNVQARFVRVEFTDLSDKSTADVKELKIYSARYEPEYYDVTYKYRLRWNDVIYEPGELKVVAYKDGAKIGESVMRTAGPPTSLRLTPDRTELLPTGEDLSFILVEAVDAEGNVAPLANDILTFQVSGGGELAAVSNGDQLSLDSFQDNRHPLFNGKAMLIVRSKQGEVSPIQVTVRAEGMEPATLSITVSQ
ncbi:DUF4982 domain-containing protein [Aeoliella sp. ICT_H6.2]|uniref:DUF4982 domain-containing protein n=1 Tax=Aeoliella straminimaris TaxID=2954799 RepID=A0A9X2JFT5_9BACT|nr:DUF4982 domain-containing protein [Aeoliella straminimaris]